MNPKDSPATAPPEPLTLRHAGLTFTVQPRYQRLDAYFAAHAENLGVTIFADDLPAARSRLADALTFMAETALRDSGQGRAEFKDYLQRKGIPLQDAQTQPAE